MKELSQLIHALAKEWSGKTLEDLRCEAVLEASGMAFEAMREANGKRLFMVMCVSGAANIDHLRKCLDLVDDGVVEDWKTLSLAEVLLRTARGGGLCFEFAKDASGCVMAVCLIAADPDSVTRLCGLFMMPE